MSRDGVEDALLRLPGGANVSLRAGTRLRLGREHASGDERAFVSREQLEVWADESWAGLRGTVLGKNPSVITGADGLARLPAARRGDEFELRPGESIGLLAARQPVAFLLGRAAAAPPSPVACDSPREGESTPKRAKSAAASPYVSMAPLVRAYTPHAKPERFEGLDALVCLTRDPSEALRSGRAYHFDERVLVAYDAYAKARVHLLLLPLGAELRGVRAPCDLRSEHVHAMRELVDCARWLERSMRASGALPDVRLLIGLHRVPSMNHLHVHFLSADLDSDALKTKRHWLSFNSTFFLPLEQCVDELERCGAADVPRAQLGTVEALLKGEMACAVCAHSAGGSAVRLSNMADVKRHVASAEHRRACRLAPAG